MFAEMINNTWGFF